jgi:hypothetical protein
MNRRIIARECLFALAALLWAFVLFPVVFSLVYPTRETFWRTCVAYFSDLGGHNPIALLVASGPYLLFQLARLGIWSIRTLRDPRRT